MASAILYKFQAATTFEALPLPGTSARLLDVKRAIVKAKRLDASTGLEFDLQVRNATNQEEYVDESKLLPRGTRLIVRRLPAARGHGLLQKLARADAGMGHLNNSTSGGPAAVPSNFYTIESRQHDENDEFVSTTTTSKTEDEKELAALMAATSQPSAVSGGPTMMGGGGGGRSNYRPAGSGPPPQQQRGGGNHFSNRPQRVADPELRDFQQQQQQQQQTSKRVTGIPRTFLNLNAPPVTTEDGTVGADGSQKIQPNALGLKELVSRGGGQAETTAGTKRDLEYALKLTATTIPDHLKCAICSSLVKDAMLLPWDPEGRTTCETCIRDKLVESGFVCPLTGTEGVSPDDLLPNVGLRKAAEHFIKGVMEKVEAIDQGAVGDDDDGDEMMDAATASKALEGEDAEKGVIVSRRSISKEGLRSKNKNDADPFGVEEEDAFGGDVFGVAAPTTSNDEKEDEENKANKDDGDAAKTTTDANNNKKTEDNDNNKDETKKETQDTKEEAEASSKGPEQQHQRHSEPKHHQDMPSPESRRDVRKHRSLPVGYSMGPAGGSAVRSRSPPREIGGRGGGGRYYEDGGRGYRGGGRGGRGGRWHDDRGGREERGRSYERGGHNNDDYGGADERAVKRPRVDDDRPPMGGRGGGDWKERPPPPYHHRGPPPPPYRGGGGRGPRGRGGRGGYRGGRGYMGRGRY